jgi:hypothetical protein
MYKRLHALLNGGLNTFYMLFQNMLVYKWLYATVLEGLHIFIIDILDCVNVEM